MAYAPEAATHTVKGRYRRPPAPWLWLALLLIPLLAALLSWFLRPQSTNAGAAPSPSPTASAAPTTGAAAGASDAAPVSVVGDERDRLFVTAVAPDDATRTSLLEAVRSSGGSKVVNRVTVSKDQALTDFTGLPAVVKEASGRLDEFGIMLTPSAVTVRGTAGSPDAAAAVEQAARQAFPGRDVRMQVATSGTGATTTAPAATPLTCTDIQSQIGERLKASPVTFEPSSTKVDSASEQRLSEIGQALAKCNATGIQVQGHTDSTGSAATNMPLSQKRAESVREALVNAGVKGESVTAKGFGATQPVASGDSPEALAQNRRVVILVGSEGQ